MLKELIVPVITPARPYLNPYRCDLCMGMIGLDGLVEIINTWTGRSKRRTREVRCVCAGCLREGRGS